MIEYVKETGNFDFLEQSIPYYEEGTGGSQVRPGSGASAPGPGFHGGEPGPTRLAEPRPWADWNDAFNMEGAESIFSACLYGKALLEMQDLMGFLGDGRVRPWRTARR